jgi:Zn-dependent peptidase ImmA (M78 family)
MNRKSIKAIVDAVLDQHDLRTLPIDIDKLASLVNASVKVGKLEEGLSGFAFQKNGMKFIGISSEENPLRRRFTLAHELGHIYLHKRDHLSYDSGLMMLRNEHSSDGTDLKEIEANRFAAELLMPEEEVRKDMMSSPNIDFMDDTKETRDFVKDLADKYKVSPRAMSVRLTTLYFN